MRVGFSKFFLYMRVSQSVIKGCLVTFYSYGIVETERQPMVNSLVVFSWLTGNGC